MKTSKIVGNIFSWVFNIVCIAALVFACFSLYVSKTTGEPATVFGYRPVYILTGSMEPYMRTNSIAITKNVDSLDELKKDDVITYHVFDTDTNQKITITHRIYDIKEDGSLITKGDNNPVADAYNLTIDNVEAKVVCVWNWVATLIAYWGTTSGKIVIISSVCGVLLFCFAIKMFFKKQ